jgi:hypothetical protein
MTADFVAFAFEDPQVVKVHLAGRSDSIREDVKRGAKTELP